MNRRRWSILLAPWLLSGCSSLTTQTYDPAKVTPSVPPPGIPFTLNKPQFTITHVPATATTPESYTAVPSYVPDSKQQFAVAMRPPWTASIDWTVSYDDGGSFAGTNAKVTDQSVATVTSFIKLAAAGAALLDTSKKTDAQELALIEAELEANRKAQPPRICCDDNHQLRPATAEESTSLRDHWLRMDGEMAKLAPDGQLSTFAYSSAEDRVVLRTAIRLTKVSYSSVQKLVDDATTENNRIINSPQNLDPPPVPATDMSKAAQQIKDAFGAYDLKALQAIQAAAVKARTAARNKLSLLDASRDDFARDPTIRLQTQIDAWAAEAINQIQAPPNDVLFHLAGLEGAAWEAQAITALNKRIDERTMAIRADALTGKIAGDAEAADPDLSELKYRKAAVLGLATVYEQTVALEKVPATSPDAFKKAQDALAPLVKQLADAETAIATASPAVGAEPAFVADVLQADNPQEASDPWIKKRAFGMPDYVVVVAPVSAPQPSPTAASTQPQPPPSGAPPPSAAPIPPAAGAPPPDAAPVPPAQIVPARHPGAA